MAVESEAYAGSDSAQSTWSIAKPSTTATGRVLVAFIGANGTGTKSPPAGWTLHESQQVGTGTGSPWLGVYYKVITDGGSEPATYDWTTTNGTRWSGWVGCYANIDNTTPFDVAATEAFDGVGTTDVAVTTMTTVTNDAQVLVGVTGKDPAANSNTFTYLPPSGFTEIRDQNADSTGSRFAVTVAEKTQFSAGSIGTGLSFTASLSIWYATITVALRPNTAASTATPSVGAFTFTNNTPGSGVDLDTLLPNGDGTVSAINSTDVTFSTEVDDLPGSAGSDYLYNDTADGSVFLTLENMPTDFASMRHIQFFYEVDTNNFTGDTCVLYGRVTAADETTAYTDEVQLATQATAAGTYSIVVPINATGLAATKTDWDAARLKLRWDYTA